jgi:molybdate transport system substrate-binding protein
MPGAELYVDLAIEKNLAFKETKKILAYFVPVIFVQVGNPKNIRSLRDLIKPGIRIGVGDERSCAIGKKTLKILKKNKIPLAAIKKNVVYKSATVNELGLAIGLKNIDAAIVWDANARHFAEQGEIIPIPPAENIPSKIPVVVLKSSSFPKLAKKFVEFASSEEGKKIWQKCKYTTSLTQ